VPGERLGEVAVRLGFATDAQIAKAAQAGKQLGRALVDAGVVTANDLWKCFHEQITTVFHSILLARDGTFQLVDEEVADRPGTLLAVNTQSLLMDGMRRIDEMSLFVARIPGPRAFVKPREPRRVITLRPPEHAVLALVDGKTTVAEIASRAHFSEFDTTKILYHLAEAGYVEAVSAPAAEIDPLQPLRTIAAGMNGLFRIVTGAVPESGRAAFRAGVRGFLADSSHGLAPVWAHAVHQDDGTLDEEQLLANVTIMRGSTLNRLEPSGDRGHLLLSALRELLFFELFLAGERLSREADEALSEAIRPQLASLEELAKVR
jgi:hypothetical protein